MNLSNLTVQQSTINPEYLKNDEVELIYQTYKKSNIDSGSVLRGLINVNQAYKSHCDELHNRFRYLNFNITENYTEWTDQEFQRIISLLHGDGIGVINSDLIKTITLSSTAIFGDYARPFYGNKDIEIIDMRPFTNFNYNRTIENTNSNLCVVNANDVQSDYKLKEIYISSTLNGSGFSPFSFVQGAGSDVASYRLEKGWYEGINTTAGNQECIFRIAAGNASNTRVWFDHFYWLNHSQGIGQNHRKTITIADTEYVYITANAGDWYHRSSSGVCYENLILDSPVPIVIGGMGGSSQPWFTTTTIYVPDYQYDIYNYLYRSVANTVGASNPAGIQTMSNYNAKFRSMANWWVYPGKTTYQTQYT